MAIANLDYEDLNILLETYEKRRVELKQTIDKFSMLASFTLFHKIVSKAMPAANSKGHM